MNKLQFDNKYGNIPDNVLSVEICVDTLDEEYYSLRQLIADTTDQDIEHAEFLVKDYQETPYVHSFVAWTEDHLLTLVHTGVGQYLLKLDRNY